jgi:membrane protease YdiL (CAAX protease family)
MDLKGIFINEFGRLRSGLRFATFLGVFIFVSLVVGTFAAAILWFVDIDINSHRALFITLNGVLSLIPAIGLGWLCGWFFEGLPFRALGCWFTNGWLKHLGLGCLVGAVTIGLAVLIASAPGGLSFTLDVAKGQEAVLETLGTSLSVFAVAAAFEESLFRGYMLQTLNRAGLGWLAIAMTAIFFGLVHLGNPGANAISTANTMLAGVWFGVAYLKTRDLWFPFGIHLVWNWMQGSVFGIEVSGLTEISPAPILNEVDRGPAWLTGESYGIEASIACTAAILVSIVLIYYLPGIRPSEEMLAMTSRETLRSEIR